MIEKVENLLDLTLDQVEEYIADLQPSFDRYQNDLPFGLTLKETGCTVTLSTKTKTATYNLEQLKKLKAEMLNPLVKSLGEMS